MRRDPIPNLFLIGAMKSSTSTLHAHLGAHPQVFMSEPKEPGYFVEELTWDRGEAWYLGLFAAAGAARAVGESSTEYTKFPRYRGVPERIARFNPEARFIYVMRDPVERTISHYWHRVVHDAERRGPLAAIRAEPDYTDFSHYALQLGRYFSLFGRDRFLLLTFEELTARAGEVVARAYRWLGVDDAFRPPDLRIRANATPAVVERVRGAGWLHRARFSKAWEVVGPHVPAGLRRAARRLSADRLDRAAEEAAVRAEVVAYLRPIQAEQTRGLGELLGREFPEWTTLHGTAAV